ncbi:MAG: hypothetical protein ACSHXY_04880 [Alphaproteobacteria bacterium]
MTLKQFLNLPETHSLSPNDVQTLNKDLAGALVKCIPQEHRHRVLDYLVNALNHGAVSSDIVSALDELRLSIEHDINQ